MIIEDIIILGVKSFISFAGNFIGIINSPYITYRRLAEKEAGIFQSVYIFFLASGYFVFASLLRTGLGNPYLLTVKFNRLFFTGTVGFLGALLVFYISGKLSGKNPSVKTLILQWSYTLIPSVFWFFTTSLLYILLPPPRTLSVMGKLYSILFVAFSIGLLYWKLILFYLTCRLGLKLDLPRIIPVFAFFSLYVSVYGIVSYRLGIFRIPFI